MHGWPARPPAALRGEAASDLAGGHHPGGRRLRVGRWKGEPLEPLSERMEGGGAGHREGEPDLG